MINWPLAGAGLGMDGEPSMRRGAQVTGHCPATRLPLRVGIHHPEAMASVGTWPRLEALCGWSGSSKASAGPHCPALPFSRKAKRRKDWYECCLAADKFCEG